MKNKFIFIYFGMVLLSSALMISCSDDQVVTPVNVPVDSSDFRYPFTDGSTWSYTITTTASDIQPDSILQYFNNYPLVISGTATILYDTVINSVITKCFRDEFTANGITRSNRYYYINNDTSLILFARRQQSPASGILPLRKIKNETMMHDYDNLNPELNNVLEIMVDTLYSTLKYPMITGTEWSNTFGEISDVKKYLGFENLTVPAGTISCMKVSDVYNISPSWIYYNYYSKSGLIKTFALLNDIVFTNVANPDGIGTYDLTGETAVTSYHISAAE
jgi:hypothetical protein